MQVEATFETVLRRHVRYVESDQPIEFGSAFVDLGVDSMATISLLADTEDTFDVEFPDELLTPETFASPQTLLDALCSILADTEPSMQG